MSVIADRFAEHLTQKELKFEYEPGTDDCCEHIEIRINGENVSSIRLVFFFFDDERTVNVKSFSLAKIPTDKLLNAYIALNGLNYQYRWVKFYLDSDNEVTIAGDAIVDEETVGEELFEVLVKFVTIIDESYPEIMKALWS